MPMRTTTTLLTGLGLTLAAGLVAAPLVAAQEPAADDAAGPRGTFNTEICTVDGLTPAQCDCAWAFVSKKLSPGDLKLAMLLIASSSEDADVARKADQALDKSNASDKRRDALASETSALVIEAEDACL